MSLCWQESLARLGSSSRTTAAAAQPQQPRNRKTAKPHNRKTAKPQNRTTA